jgi:hypothetical protein
MPAPAGDIEDENANPFVVSPSARLRTGLANHVLRQVFKELRQLLAWVRFAKRTHDAFK